MLSFELPRPKGIPSGKIQGTLQRSPLDLGTFGRELSRLGVKKNHGSDYLEP